MSAKLTGREPCLVRSFGYNLCSLPTRSAGPLTRPDPSVATRHLPTLWGVTLTEGASKHPTT